MKTILILASLYSSLSFAEAKNTQTNTGRFQLIQLSDMRRDQYMIDTQTGKIWSKGCEVSENTTSCLYEVWWPQDVVGINATLEQVSKRAAILEKRDNTK